MKRSQASMRGTATGTAGLHLAVLIPVVVVLLPVVWAVSASFKSAGDIFQSPPDLLPSRPTIDNYITLFTSYPVARWLFNSFSIAVAVTVLGLLISALGGFALAKYDFAGKDLILRATVASLVIPFITLLVPLYVLVSRVGLVDTHLAIIIPSVVQPFGIFLMRQYVIQTVPDEILDSARVDGANEYRIFASIALPLLRPGLGVLAIWLFLASFNNFLWPLMVLSGPEKLTLPIGLVALSSGYGVEYGAVMAGVVTTLIPPLIIFIVLQRQFVQGLTRGALAN